MVYPFFSTLFFGNTQIDHGPGGGMMLEAPRPARPARAGAGAGAGGAGAEVIFCQDAD